MRDLIPLVELISTQKVRQIDLITEDNGSKSKSKELYNALKDEIVTDDASAEMLLYGTSSNSKGYVKIKQRLKDKLINNLFFIDTQAYSRTPYQKAELRSYKNWAASRILRSKGLVYVSRRLSERTLSACMKYDFTELTLSILREQKLRYGLYEYNKAKYIKYSALLGQYEKINKYEIIAEHLFCVLAKVVTSKKALEFTKEIKLLEAELQNHKMEICSLDSYKLRFYFYNASFYIAYIKQDHEDQLNISEEALAYFSKKEGFNTLGLNSFRQKKGLCLLKMARFEEGQEIFRDVVNMKPNPGTITWQSVHNYYFLSQLLAKDYQGAYETLSSLTNHKAYKKVPDHFSQPWRIKGAFIHFLIARGQIDPSKSKSRKLKKFRLNRFINDVAFTALDKRGLNLTINIIRILFLLEDKDFEVAEERIFGLKQYKYRYLKGQEFTRAKAIILLFQKIPQCRYDIDLIRKKSAKAYQILLDNPIDFSEQSIQIEIIPYERIWEEVLAMMAN